MRKKMYKILDRKADSVLLVRELFVDGVYMKKYVVKDIENDVIFSCYNDEERARQEFNSYDLNKVREEREDEFNRWLEEFAEA